MLRSTLAAALLAIVAAGSIAAPASAQLFEGRQERVEARRLTQPPPIKSGQFNIAGGRKDPRAPIRRLAGVVYDGGLQSWLALAQGSDTVPSFGNRSGD